MEHEHASDPIWDDLAALAFELLAKPDYAAGERADDRPNAADDEEGER